MRAATRESARERMISKRMMSITALVLISICFLVPKAAAQSDKYSKMAPVDQYLMERIAEILLPRGIPGSSKTGFTRKLNRIRSDSKDLNRD
jgi:hypothetical protein